MVDEETPDMLTVTTQNEPSHIVGSGQLLCDPDRRLPYMEPGVLDVTTIAEDEFDGCEDCQRLHDALSETEVTPLAEALVEGFGRTASQVALENPEIYEHEGVKEQIKDPYLISALEGISLREAVTREDTHSCPVYIDLGNRVVRALRDYRGLDLVKIGVEHRGDYIEVDTREWVVELDWIDNHSSRFPWSSKESFISVYRDIHNHALAESEPVEVVMNHKSSHKYVPHRIESVDEDVAQTKCGLEIPLHESSHGENYRQQINPDTTGCCGNCNKAT